MVADDVLGRARGRKDHQVNIRVNDWEYERLRALALDYGYSLTEYLLASTVYADVLRDDSPRVLRGAYDELRAQGINLNQAVKVANAAAKSGGKSSVSDALDAIASMKRDLASAQSAVVDALRHSRPRRRAMRTPPAALMREGHEGDES